MMTRTRNVLTVSFISLFFVACVTRADTNIAFGGYHFNSQQPPSFIGSTHESLVLHFAEDKKLIFVYENYSN